jgi:hypothetical protein
LIGRKDFHNFHWTKKTNSKRGHGKIWGGVKNFLSCVFGKGGEWVCERKINLLCVKKCCSWKQIVCKQKSMEKNYV